MKIRIIVIFIFLLSTSLAIGQQGYTYSYLDPCTSKAKEIYVDTSNGSVPLTYNGQIQFFSAADLQSGAFQTWINSVNNQNPTGPCSGVALTQSTALNVQVASNNISVITTVMSTLSSMAAMQDVVTSTTGAVTSMGGNTVTGTIQADEKVSSNNDNKEDSKNENSTTTNNTSNGTNNTNGGTSSSGGNKNSPNTQSSQTTSSGTGGSTSNQGNSNSTTTNSNATGNQSPQSSVNSNSNSQPQGQNNQNSPSVSGNAQSQGQTTSDNTSNSGGAANVTGGIGSLKVDNAQQSESSDAKAEGAASSGASSSSSAKSKVAAVKQGSLMMNGDIVTITSASDEPQQLKINASIISSNTKNTFAKGALINFTSHVNNTNVTLFVSFRHKNLTTIFANSMMMNFDKDFFDTASIMESYKMGRITGTVGVNLTMGNIGVSKFTSLSTLAGLFSTFKINRKIGLTTMFVSVYSPYVFYYEGMWYQSKILAVPFLAVDYKLTKKFKINISFSGVQQINDKPISYQILTGAKCLL